MKEIWLFIKWNRNKWDFTQKVWVLGGLFLGSGSYDWYKTGEVPWQIFAAFSIWGLIILKWFIWDGITESWKRFKAEKQQLFTTIKEGK